MGRHDYRARHLGWIEIQLKVDNPELPNLQIIADSHYGPGDHVARVDAWGVRADRCRREEIRHQAEELLRKLGYDVGCAPGRDAYELDVERPTSAHEEIRYLQSLRAALAASTGTHGSGAIS